MPMQPVLKTPTTLGASNGQFSASVPPPAGRSRSLVLVLLAVVVLGGGGAAVGVVATRGGGGPAPTHDAGGGGLPATPDAVPVLAADAAVPVTALPDAAAPDAAVPDAAPPPPVDAAPPPADAAIDAPKRGHRPPRNPPNNTVPHAGSGSTTPGCDRSIDTDCDGIPDVR
jgi:hypothetical protein